MRQPNLTMRSLSLVFAIAILVSLVPTAAAADAGSPHRAIEAALDKQGSPSAAFTASPVPTISGSAVIGNILTANVGTWSPTPDSVYLQWNRDGRPINGANGLTLQLNDADLSAVMTVTVEAFLFDAGWQSRVSAPTPRVELHIPFDPPFADVGRGSQFYFEITWMRYNSISRGWITGGGQFVYLPLQPVNRDAMAAFLYRLAGEPYVPLPVTSPFVDVSTSNQFYKEINWLAQEGISTGWDVGGGMNEFRPLQPVARDAMAAFLFRIYQAYGGPLPTESPFADVPVNSPFIEEITWLAESGISTGWDRGDGTRDFRPLQAVNRDAMAAFMYRFDRLYV